MHYIKLNKLLKKPLYLQLAESIEQAFNQKELNAGDLLPTEKEICESFGVSTSVVKYAYKWLMEKGIVKREVGRGTFVWDEMHEILETQAAFELFLNYTHFKREVIYIEDIHNTLDTLHPVGELRVVYELVKKRTKPLALRKLFVQKESSDTFLEEGWNTDQRLRIKTTRLTPIQSYMRVVNLEAKEARILGLKPYAPAFFQKVDCFVEDTLVGVLENYYPGEHFTWRQIVEEIRLRPSD